MAAAAALWREAAEKGYAPAQHNFAASLIAGDGVEQDFALALSWLKKAADQGLDRSIYTLGKMYT